MTRLTLMSAIALGVAVGACSNRPESPQFFEKVTGIRLCDDARVINTPIQAEKDAGIGIVYSVEVRMDEMCERSFLAKASELRSRSPVAGGPGRKNDWIEIHRIAPGRLSVVYTG